MRSSMRFSEPNFNAAFFPAGLSDNGAYFSLVVTLLPLEQQTSLIINSLADLLIIRVGPHNTILIDQVQAEQTRVFRTVVDGLGNKLKPVFIVQIAAHESPPQGVSPAAMPSSP